jgi:hypothetical protein
MNAPLTKRTDPMLRKANAQGLMDLIRANEEAPNFNLGSWVEPCGTFGCLVGNWAIRCNRMWMLDSDGIYDLAAESLGITRKESRFLFSTIDVVRDRFGFEVPGLDRDCENRSAAINRVRKFLYYKLRKWELLYEEDGRVKESARKQEGDRMVCREALEACSA